MPSPGADKGEEQAVSNISAYTWNFMLRREPLENALKACRSSKVFAEEVEEELERKRDERHLKRENEGSMGSKTTTTSAKKKAIPNPAGVLMGGETQIARGDGLVARDDDEEVEKKEKEEEEEVEKEEKEEEEEEEEDDEEASPSMPLLKT